MRVWCDYEMKLHIMLTDFSIFLFLSTMALLSDVYLFRQLTQSTCTSACRVLSQK